MIDILCKCGCNGIISINKCKGRQTKFLPGHQNGGINNSIYGSHRSGKSNPNYRGEKCITPLNIIIRTGSKYADWRTQVFGRDNFTCQKCEVRGTWLEVHHIKKFSVIINDNNIIDLEWALNCEELWDISNGITLCKQCHKDIHND